jgi:hypothetical protein
MQQTQILFSKSLFIPTRIKRKLMKQEAHSQTFTTNPAEIHKSLIFTTLLLENLKKKKSNLQRMHSRNKHMNQKKKINNKKPPNVQ